MAGKSESFDIDQDDSNASVTKNHEHGGEKLYEEILGMIKNLDPPPASPRKGLCIYRVPKHICRSNELEAYTPQVISIGPFHHKSNPKLQEMEKFKLIYLMSFRDRAETKLEDILSTIKGAEESVRKCYSETIMFSSDDFVTMILFDATFIIEYFWKNKTKVNWTEYDRERLKPWLCNRMQMDLILLENQLPFFIIEKIYDTAFPSRSKRGHPFIELCFHQFEYYNVQNFPHSGSEEILHFTDLVRNFCIPPHQRRPKRSSQSMKKMYSAAQLDAVGLKFKMRTSSINIPSPLELKYADGVLEIPRFQLDSTTEIYARNLIAFEECHYHQYPYITDYYILLSMLIKTVKDMDVLEREQIIDNWLDGDVATSMIKKLPKTSNLYFQFQMNSDYDQMAQQLKTFYANQISLRGVLFRTSFRSISTISASAMMILTLVQVVCSILSLKSVS